MIAALSWERKADIKLNDCVNPHNEGYYQSALLKESPVALTEARRIIEKATEFVKHEIINIGISEDMADLWHFQPAHKKKPRLCSLEGCLPPWSTMHFSGVHPYLLISNKRGRVNRITFGK